MTEQTLFPRKPKQFPVVASKAVMRARQWYRFAAVVIGMERDRATPTKLDR